VEGDGGGCRDPCAGQARRRAELPRRHFADDAEARRRGIREGQMPRLEQQGAVEPVARAVGRKSRAKHPPKDSKYGVCFRACLAFLPSYIASEFKLAKQTTLAEQTTIKAIASTHSAEITIQIPALPFVDTSIVPTKCLHSGS